MLLGISLGTLLVCLCVLCNRRVERLAAPFVCGLMLLEYLLALFGRLEWLMWIALACALGALAVLLVSLAKGHGKIEAAPDISLRRCIAGEVRRPARLSCAKVVRGIPSFI